MVCPAAASFGHDCAKVGRLTVKYGFKFATREKEDVAWRVDCGRSDGSGAESGHGHDRRCELGCAESGAVVAQLQAR